MRSSIVRTTWTAISVSVVGCTTLGEDGREESVNVHPTVETQRTLASRSSFVDEQGRTWVRRGPVVYKDVSLERLRELEASAFTPSPTKNIATLPLDELAELLNPVTEFDGYEFSLDRDSAREFARVIQSVAIESAEKDARGASGAPGSSPTARPEVGTTSQAVMVDGESRLNISHIGNVFPYNLHGWFGTTTSPGCTCAKMINNFTCVTSAHCQHDGSGWLTRLPITFQPTASPLPQIPTDCYGRIVPNGWNSGTSVNWDFDYAVIYLRGRNGAWCSVSSYDVGFFGWNTVGNGEINIPTWLSGFPFNDRPAGWPYPVLAWDDRNDTYQPASLPGRIRHRCDSTGGQSGAAIVKNWGGGDYRALGVNTGGAGADNIGPRMTSAVAAWMASVAGF